jgi:hypothetical protein
MFRETITSADESSEQGSCTEAHALSLLRAAVRRGYRVEATRQGGAVIVRDVATGLSVVPRHRTIILEPVTVAGTVTATMRADLDALARRDGKSPAEWRDGRIRAGLYCIPPAAVRRLVARGLVTASGQCGPVALTLAARLAMLATDHRTTTSKPPGYQYPSDMAYRDALRTGQVVTLSTPGIGAIGLNKPGRRAGRAYYRDSTASCSCRWSWPAEDREDARRRARGHRQEATAAMLAELTGLTAHL